METDLKKIKKLLRNWTFRSFLKGCEMKEASLKDVFARFKDNWVGYVSEYRIFLIITLLTALADMVSTSLFMLREGPDAEVHPAIRVVCIIFGPIAGPLIGKICQLIAILGVSVYFRRYATYLFLPVIILYSWAAWYNIWGCHLYYPRLLWLLELL